MLKSFFEIVKEDIKSRARLGLLNIGNYEVETPAFVPLGSQTDLKDAVGSELKFWGAKMIAVDSFQLFVRPGDQMISKAGGLGPYLGFRGPVLSDAGRFRPGAGMLAFKFFETGIFFQASGADALRLFTPEQSIQTQINLGADIITTLACPEQSGGKIEARKAADFTFSWAERAKRMFEKIKPTACTAPKIFGAVAASDILENIITDAAKLRELDFDGYSFTFSPDPIKTLADLEEEKPRHLCDAAMPELIVRSIAAGIDTFDSNLPVELAQTGRLFVNMKPDGYGILDVRNKKYAQDPVPPDNTCNCYLCLHHNLSELHRLILQSDIAAKRLSVIHNFRFYFNFLEKVRRAIKYESFDDLLASYRQTET
ncbi:MAG: tRNA guanosine(34) transglycosylase Tgt [Patescibacteria group bacterium]